MSDSSDGQPPETYDDGRLHVEDLVREGEHTLVLNGEVDLLAASDLEDAVRRACEAGTARIVLDLRGVTFMDSTGLRAMLSAQELCAEHGCELSLIPATRQVQSLFQMTGLAERLPFQKDGQPAPAPKDAIVPRLFAPSGDADDER